MQSSKVHHGSFFCKVCGSSWIGDEREVHTNFFSNLYGQNIPNKPYMLSRCSRCGEYAKTEILNQH